MIRILTPILVFALAFPIATFAESGNVFGSGVDLTKMSARELSEFYKKNPDYGKNRIGLDYSKYIEGDWVVFRGELSGKDGLPIVGSKASMVIPGITDEPYLAVTNKNGVFSMELPKKDFGGASYRAELRVDGFIMSTPLVPGDELKRKSIYHFKVTKSDGESAKLETIHNAVFGQPKPDTTILVTPSGFGIQGWAFIVLIALTLGLGALSWLNMRKEG